MKQKILIFLAFSINLICMFNAVESLTCYSCYNCSDPFKPKNVENTTCSTDVQEYCTIVITKNINTSSTYTSRGCLGVCLDDTFTANGQNYSFKTQCCDTDLCNGKEIINSAPNIKCVLCNKLSIIAIVWFVWYYPNIYN